MTLRSFGPSVESNLKKPGLLPSCAFSRAYAFQLRPVCIIPQSLMHVIAFESLVDFRANENEHYKLTANAFLCAYVAATFK